MPRALIVGAGVGGLTAAAALGKRGFEVLVVETKPVYAVVGVGIGLRANSLRLLRSLGVLDDLLAVGFVREEFVHCDRFGRFLCSTPSGYAADGIPYSLGLQRTDLAAVLTKVALDAGAEIRLATTYTSIRTGPPVSAELSDGTSGEFDLALGFDGIYSTTRRDLFGEHAVPEFTGYAAWRVPLASPAAITRNTYFQGLARKAGVALIGSGRMYLVLVAPQEGRPRHEPDRLHEVFRQQWHEGDFGPDILALADEVTSPDGIAYTPFEEVLLERPWHQGATLVLGDAAHSSTPHLGQGASMAIEDAVVLAGMLGEAGRFARVDVGEQLTRFYERRIPRVRLVHDVSHQMLLDEMDTATADKYDHRIATMPEVLLGQHESVRAALDEEP